MGAKKKIIVIDTNVFIIDIRYKRDEKFNINRQFLDSAGKSGAGMTTIFNLLEICGILSFNLNRRQLDELFAYFGARYNVKIVPTADPAAPLPFFTANQIFDRISQKTSLGDSLILSTVDQYLPGASLIVSWDKDHLENKIDIPVLTPEEFTPP